MALFGMIVHFSLQILKSVHLVCSVSEIYHVIQDLGFWFQCRKCGPKPDHNSKFQAHICKKYTTSRYFIRQQASSICKFWATQVFSFPKKRASKGLTAIANSRLIFARNTRPVGISSGDKHHRSAFYKMSLVFAWRSGSTPHLGQNYFWRRILMIPMTHFFLQDTYWWIGKKNRWNFS